MTAPKRPYSRVYHSILDDDKFDGIREDMRHLGTWALLLVLADIAYPGPALLPASAPRASVRALADRGLVDLLSGGRYRVHGLGTEREMRSQSARNAAASRWDTDGDAVGLLERERERERD